MPPYGISPPRRQAGLTRHNHPAIAPVVRVVRAGAVASAASGGGLAPSPGISQRSQDETDSRSAAGSPNLIQEFSLARFDFPAAAPATVRRRHAARREVRPGGAMTMKRICASGLRMTLALLT